MKKRIGFSNLLLRFYLREGWTKEELDLCAAPKRQCMLHPKSQDDPYFIFDVGNPYIPERLLEIGYIQRRYLNVAYPKKANMTDLEILEQMNWRQYP